MTPFRGIITSSTKTTLEVELDNGHKVKGLPPNIKLRYGQAVFVYYDYVKDRYRRVEASDGIIEDPGRMPTREALNISRDDVEYGDLDGMDT